MNKKLFFNLSIAITSLFLIILLSACNTQDKQQLYKNVYDYANVLKKEEINDLYKIIRKFDNQNISAIFVTTNNTNNLSDIEYADFAYDDTCENLKYPNDGLLFLINIQNKTLYINTVGKCIQGIPREYIDHVLDNVYLHATREDYGLCFKYMAEECYNIYSAQTNSGSLYSIAIPTGKSLVFSFATTILIITTLLLAHYNSNKSPNVKIYSDNDFYINFKNDVFIGDTKEVIRNYYKQPTKSDNNVFGGGFNE